MSADRFGADHVEPHGCCGSCGLHVQVEQDLEVIGHESDRNHHDIGNPVGRQLLEMLRDIRLEPWDVRGA